MTQEQSDLPKLASQAQRALAEAGITRLIQFTKMSEAELLQLHGIGPKTIKALRLALKAKGLSFLSEKESKDVVDNKKSDKYKDFYALLEQIRSGLESEKAEALNRFYELVRDSDDDMSWYLFSIGLIESRRFDASIPIISGLLDGNPNNDAFRITLSTAYVQTEQFELARYHYQYLADRATTEEGHRSGQEGLAGLSTLLDNEVDNQFLQLKIAALRESVAYKDASAEHYERLASLLLQVEFRPTFEVSIDEITALLVEGHTKFPRAIGILELLAQCYSRQELEEPLEHVLKQIESIDPDHSLIQMLYDDMITDPDENAFERANHLFELSQSKESELVKIALSGLYKIVTLHPNDNNYRSLYALALLTNGQHAQAIHHAEFLAARAGQNFRIHANVGQFFYIIGDKERGKWHLEQAYEYAPDDNERLLISEQMVELYTK